MAKVTIITQNLQVSMEDNQPLHTVGQEAYNLFVAILSPLQPFNQQGHANIPDQPQNKPIINPTKESEVLTSYA